MEYTPSNGFFDLGPARHRGSPDREIVLDSWAEMDGGARMRFVLVALTLALLMVPSYAQMTQTTTRSDQQKKSDKEADDAYKAMIKNVPDKTRDTDPWKEMRGGDAASNNSANGTSARSSHATTKKPK